MKIVIQPDAEHAVRFAAELIARQVRDAPDSVLGLATGRTMEALYDRLAEWHRDKGLDFSRCRTFNLDEYAGLPPGDPNSYRATMGRLLFDRVNLDPARAHVPDGTAPDPAAECRDYEARIAACGGIDLQLLGIGLTGHIGFNEPLSALQSRTRPVALTPGTIRQNAPFFGGDPDRMPRRALTMGVGTILEARRLLLLATGESKAEILARAVEGPVSASVPASAIQFHPDCRVVVDEAAARGLAAAADARWMLRHDPDGGGFRAGPAGRGPGGFANATHSFEALEKPPSSVLQA